MEGISTADWEVQRQELADMLGIEASKITVYRKEDGSIHVQVGEAAQNNKQISIYSTDLEQDETPSEEKA